jgi:hypothetical protein
MVNLRKITTNLALLALLGTALSGCVVAIGNDGMDEDDDWQQRQERNSRYIRQLDLGQSMNLIESELGTPDFNESFQRDGETFQILYYRTRQAKEDGKTSMDETTPLVFIDNSLVGWGETAIDKATR